MSFAPLRVEQSDPWEPPFLIASWTWKQITHINLGDFSIIRDLPMQPRRRNNSASDDLLLLLFALQLSTIGTSVWTRSAMRQDESGLSVEASHPHKTLFNVLP